MINKLISKYKPNIISFIGAGGKSELMKKIASVLRSDKKILMSSTIDVTRISEDQIDLIDYEFKEDYNLCRTYENGVYVMAGGITNDNRLKGLPVSTLSSLSKCFDLSLIECDFTQGRSLKAWRKDEPLILDGTDLLIYILDITMIGKILSVDTVHNVDVFVDVTGRKIGEPIELEDIVTLLRHKESNFESLGIRRMMFMNKVEDAHHEKNAIEIFERTKDLGFEIVVFGSIKNNVVTILKEEDENINNF